MSFYENGGSDGGSSGRTLNHESKGTGFKSCFEMCTRVGAALAHVVQFWIMNTKEQGSNLATCANLLLHCVVTALKRERE